ncbi:MAG: hypothetical protein IPM66_01675 [Acidobacteriota bacterium]|nr:MAG: hypothetical protein IPM66_01675 [Acidobacteriota bacterium]
MIELLLLGREQGAERLEKAIAQALELGCTDAAAVRYLMQASGLVHQPVELIDLPGLARYQQPAPVITSYDQLLSQEVMR